MLKEKITKVKEFVMEHKTKIAISIVTCGTLGTLCYKNKEIITQLTKVTNIARNSLEREVSRIKFEIEEIQNSIDRLDSSRSINKYHRIPERQSRIEELTIQLKELHSDLNNIE